MNDLCREEHPLLCEDLSDDGYSPQFHRRLRPSTYKGRARNNLKGVAAIITRWPDHWSIFLTYWWIGLGMICLTTFILYNSLFTFPIQIAETKPTTAGVNSAIATTNSTPLLRDVYMHVFLDENEEIDLETYVPYIEKITNKYTEFKYHLLLVYNDTTTKAYSDEQNNEIALNLLWDKDVTKKPITKSNINIEYTSLSTYMENSPLRKYWRTLPHQLIEFLVRAISIWNKGGVAFNPNILTPRSSHTMYVDKLRKLLNNFPTNHSTESKLKTTKKTNTKVEYHKQELNNIRDIINALENNDVSMNIISHETLAVAEDKDLPVIMKSGRSLFNSDEGDRLNKTKSTIPINNSQIQPRANMNSLENSSRAFISDNQNSTETNTYFENGNHSRKQSLLPLFLKYLFNTKGSSNIQSTETAPINVSHRTRKSVIRTNKNNNYSLSTNETERKVGNTNEPIIISTKPIHTIDEHVDNHFGHEIQKKIDSNRLTIDLKGNIVATDTPCHAFLGTIFSNAIHHNAEETVTDFIIAELSVFCKGLLSTCMGIDVILL